MGNCIGLSASSRVDEEEQEKQFEFHQPASQETDYDDPAEKEEEQEYYDRTIPSSSAATNAPTFLETPDHAAEIESEDSELKKSAAGRSSPSKKLMDPRLNSVLEFFRQLYVRKNALFKRIISIHREDFVELLNSMERSKEEAEVEKVKAKSMKRSHSFAAIRGVQMDSNELKLQRFKVKTLDTDDDLKGPKGAGAGAGGGKGAGGIKTGGGSK